jgi:hypothetical protein
MSPEVIDKTLDTAKTAIEALKVSPYMLGLVLLQFGVIGALLYSSIDRQNAISKQFENLYQTLDKCISGHITGTKP